MTRNPVGAAARLQPATGFKLHGAGVTAGWSAVRSEQCGVRSRWPVVTSPHFVGFASSTCSRTGRVFFSPGRRRSGTASKLAARKLFASLEVVYKEAGKPGLGRIEPGRRLMNLTRLLRAVAAALLAALIASLALARAQEAPPASLLGGGAAGTQAQPGAAAAGGLTLPPQRAVEMLRSSDQPPRGSEAPAPPADARPPGEPPPKAPPTDFQRFAATSVGALLPIFGQDLFTRAPTTFAPVQDLPASPDYVVGPGDEIVIRGWGQIEIDVRAVVSREGGISIPRVGVVSVLGVRYQDLGAHLKRAVSRYYRNFELAVSLGRLRSIQVFVVGQAQRPGLYTVSSLATLLNALFAAGGPSPTGSMRKVQLRRGERLVGELDLYDLLLKGDKSKDQRLQSGDVIFIPPVGPVAAIAGRVKTPAVFELRGDATSLAELVAYAGGISTTAATQSLVLERLDRRLGRVVRELPWSDASLATRLADGDVVAVRAVSQKFDNAVTLRGHVAFPIRTAWKEGLTVADLIPDLGLLIPESYWERVAARAYEQELPDAAAAPGREVAPSGRRDGPPGRSLARRESQTAAAQAEAQERLKTDVENLVDEVNWDYAVIERLDRQSLEPRLVPFNLGKALKDKDPAHNLPLEPGDIVTVFSRKDILSPAEKRTYFVRVEGEVATPGVYQVRPGETVRQLVERAGGLTRDAYLFGAEFNRESVKKEQQSRLDEIATRAEQELERTAAERLARALGPEDVAATRGQVEEQRRTIARLRALRPAGRMVLGLGPKAAAAADLPDLTLEDGDRLYVPPRHSTVGVYGAVYTQGNFVYERDKRLDDYLDRAGGPTRAADTGSTYVLRADGSVMSKRQSGWFSSFGGRELMPNDSIVVPEDYAPVSWVKELKDWTQILYQFGLGVAAIKILTQ